MIKDNVHCNFCGKHNLIKRGSETCPSCGKKGYLDWNEPQEIEVADEVREYGR